MGGKPTQVSLVRVPVHKTRQEAALLRFPFIFWGVAVLVLGLQLACRPCCAWHANVGTSCNAFHRRSTTRRRTRCLRGSRGSTASLLKKPATKEACYTAMHSPTQPPEPSAVSNPLHSTADATDAPTDIKRLAIMCPASRACCLYGCLRTHSRHPGPCVSLHTANTFKLSSTRYQNKK